MLTGCATTQPGQTTSLPKAEEARARETVSTPAPDTGAKTAVPDKEAPPVAPAQTPEEIKRVKILAAIRSLAKLQDKGVQHLSELAESKETDVRLASLETLGMIEHPSALDPLIMALADEDHTIRETATRTLIYRGPLLTQVHVDKLLFIVRNATKGWPDPAFEGATIYVTHYAGKVLSQAKSPIITPKVVSEADEAVQRYE